MKFVKKIFFYKMITTESLLPTIDTSSLVDKVEMQLTQILLDRKLMPGDPIPTEKELATMLGVSRTVVRESINRLKTVGMIESKKKKGAVIKSPDITLVLQKSMIPHMLDNQTLRDTFEMRLVIEVGMADLLVARATKKDIEELYEIVGNEPEKTKNTLFDIEHEVKFHGKLYEITQNETLKSFQNLLLPVFNYVYDSNLLHVPVKIKRHVTHKQLIDLLKEGNAKDLREGMRKHLENHFSRVLGASRTH